MLKNVELDRFSQRTALTNRNDITFTNINKAGRAVNRHVLMPFFKPSVLLDVLKVITADNDGSLHLVRDDHGLEDTTSNAHIASEGAFFINICTLNCLLGGFKAKAYALIVTHATLLGLLSQNTLATNENAILLLIGLLGYLFKRWVRVIEEEVRNVRKSKRQTKFWQKTTSSPAVISQNHRAKYVEEDRGRRLRQNL